MPQEARPIAPAAVQGLTAVARLLRACIQCGTCSGSCPNAFAMDMTPRRMWRLVTMGRGAEVFTSATFTLCSACYLCTLRCPRGLPLTEAMALLKQTAHQAGIHLHAGSERFHQAFLESIRRHGRVREMEVMTRYFGGMRNPWLPIRFAGLGLRLLRRGKLTLQLPVRGSGKLDHLFARGRAAGPGGDSPH
jgi:heterodisulfide reductase subunit C